jgi:hypothetical protein
VSGTTVLVDDSVEVEVWAKADATRSVMSKRVKSAMFSKD